jgi:hypothetical protein
VADFSSAEMEVATRRMWFDLHPRRQTGNIATESGQTGYIATKSGFGLRLGKHICIGGLACPKKQPKPTYQPKLLYGGRYGDMGLLEML